MPHARADDPIVYASASAAANGPARGLATLYVSQVRPLEEVRGFCDGHRHVVLEVASGPQIERLRAWASVARGVLDDGLWVSAVYPAVRHAEVRLGFEPVWARSRFVPNAQIDLESQGLNQNQTLTIEQGKAGGARWSVVLADLDRAWCWTPSSGSRTHTVLARLSDLPPDTGDCL